MDLSFAEYLFEATTALGNEKRTKEETKVAVTKVSADKLMDLAIHVLRNRGFYISKTSDANQHFPTTYAEVAAALDFSESDKKDAERAYRVVSTILQTDAKEYSEADKKKNKEALKEIVDTVADRSKDKSERLPALQTFKDVAKAVRVELSTPLNKKDLDAVVEKFSTYCNIVDADVDPKISSEDKEIAAKAFKAYGDSRNGETEDAFKKYFVPGGSIDRRSVEQVITALGKTVANYKLIDTYSEKWAAYKDMISDEDKDAYKARAERGEKYAALVKEVAEKCEEDRIGTEGQRASIKLEHIIKVGFKASVAKAQRAKDADAEDKLITAEYEKEKEDKETKAAKDAADKEKKIAGFKKINEAEDDDKFSMTDRVYRPRSPNDTNTKAAPAEVVASKHVRYYVVTVFGTTDKNKLVRINLTYSDENKNAIIERLFSKFPSLAVLDSYGARADGKLKSIDSRSYAYNRNTVIDARVDGYQMAKLLAGDDYKILYELDSEKLTDLEASVKGPRKYFGVTYMSDDTEEKVAANKPVSALTLKQMLYSQGVKYLEGRGDYVGARKTDVTLTIGGMRGVRVVKNTTTGEKELACTGVTQNGGKWFIANIPLSNEPVLKAIFKKLPSVEELSSESKLNKMLPANDFMINVGAPLKATVASNRIKENGMTNLFPINPNAMSPDELKMRIATKNVQKNYTGISKLVITGTK